MDTIRVLYLENSKNVRDMYREYFKERIKFDFVNNVEAFDEFLFSDKESYDFIFIDLSVNINGELTELCEKIAEFKKEKIPTKVKGTLQLIGYDYIKFVMKKREKTKDLINKGRVIVVSGHYNIMKKEGLITDEVFKGIPFFDRAKTPIREIDRIIRRVSGG